MVLTDTDIRNILCPNENWENAEEKLKIYPFNEESLTPVGYDLRVGNTYTSTSQPGLCQLSQGNKIIIKPGDTALITTLEYIGMPQNFMTSALIVSKVSKVSRGLSHISTNIDPDWKGNLLIALHNHSMNKIELEYGESFCTIVFLENKSNSTKPCNKPDGRLDLYMQEWARKASLAKKRERIKLLYPPIIILFSFGIGYYFFGNNPGLIASVAIGTALSQVVKLK